MIFSPFEQFKIVELLSLNYNYTITNSLFQLINWVFFFSIFTVFILYSKKKKFELSFFVRIMTLIYVFFFQLISSYVGKHVNTYFPFLFYLFFFILNCNLIGLLPYSFTLTSHFIITIGLAFTVWYGIFLVAYDVWGIRLVALFYPKGISVILVFFLSAIELLSYVFRVFSLALRLLANMIAGHILLDCLAFYIHKVIFTSVVNNSISIISILYTVIPLIFLIVLFIFELGVAVLQSYIFVILSCIYLKEVL